MLWIGLKKCLSLRGSLQFSLSARVRGYTTRPSPLPHFAQRLTDDYDRYIVLSFTNATMVLEVRVVGLETGFTHLFQTLA